MKILEKARWLSLDITIGAVVLLFFICAILGLVPGVHVYLGLAIAIWSIYTLDHLNDARKLASPSTGRHRYHKDNFGNILSALVVVLLVGIINIFYLPEKLIYLGLLVAAFSCFYLLLQKYIARLALKELAIGFGYTLGILLFPISNLGLTVTLLLFTVQLFLVAFINIVLIAYFDHEVDKRDGSFSLAIMLGKQKTRKLLFLLITVAVVLAVSDILFIQTSLFFDVFVIASHVVYILIMCMPSFFKVKDRFRFFSDLIFFLPLILLLFR